MKAEILPNLLKPVCLGTVLVVGGSLSCERLPE